MEQFEGVIPPVTTPFTPQGAILYQALEHNLKRYSATPCSGFLLLGSNGEAPHLSETEKIELVRRAVDLLPQNRHLLVGVGASSLLLCLRFVEKLRNLRIDAVLVSVPNYYRDRMDHESLRRYYSGVADRCPFPVLLYNIPQYSGIELPPDVVGELSSHANICGMKDSSGDLVYLERVQEAIGGQDFQLLLGSARILGPALPLGIRAAILAVACPFPTLICSLMEDYRTGKSIQRAQLLVREVARVLGSYGLPGIKFAMDLLDFRGLECRLPLLPLKPSQKAEIKSFLGSMLKPIEEYCSSLDGDQVCHEK